MTTQEFSLPVDLPRPIDDGACDHLPDMDMDMDMDMGMLALALASTGEGSVDLHALGTGRTVIYAYPMTSVPGVALPDGWDMIPGARGCTPQSCGFRDHHDELAGLGARVFGLSTQETAYQQEMATRLHLPFDVLSDAEFALCDALRLPTFDVVAGGTPRRLLKRLTLVVSSGRIEHAFYPVFPPNESADQVMAWLRANPA